MLRDVLIRVGLEGLVRAYWTKEILDETFRSLPVKRPDLGAAHLSQTRQLMCEALPGAMVTGYE